MLRHSSAAMTFDVYAGLFGDDLDSVAALLDSHVPRVRHIAEIELPKGGHNDAAQGADLHKRGVGQVGLEPTTDGL